LSINKLNLKASSVTRFYFFINATDTNSEKYTALVNAKPTFTVKDGGDGTYTLTRVTPTKTVTFSFKSGDTVTSDPLGADQPLPVIRFFGKVSSFIKTNIVPRCLTQRWIVKNANVLN
jgi:hypothetical protein